jgi:glutamyl-tRNA reductase
MSLVVIGISHKTAPVELREKISFPREQLEGVLSEVRGKAPGEVAILSTCNRTEIYAHGPDDLEGWCVKLLERRLGTGAEKYVYRKAGPDMIGHLFRVAGGLDSLVVGENEILKQVKDAYGLAHQNGLTAKVLNVLFQRALYVGKLVRTQTSIGQGSVSVGSVAVSLAEKIFGDLSESEVLVFGAGKMAEVSSRYLLGKKVRKLLVANRTLENAKALAAQFGAEALTLEEGFGRMASADIVITSMSADRPVLTAASVGEWMLRRRNRSLFIIDIAVPRNVETAVHQLDNVYLYNIDDLQAIAQENIRGRSAEIDRAVQIVSEKSREFFDWYESLASGREKSLKHWDEVSGGTPAAR